MFLKDVLIGTVFANDSQKQQDWLDLQLNFISRTTKSYDHVAVVTEGLSNDYFASKTNVLIPPDTSLRLSRAHHQGLQMLLKHFREHSSEYSSFLFIDSDAFPIKKGWWSELMLKLSTSQIFDKSGMALCSKGREREIAIALRPENLESRLHASILLAKPTALQHLDFEFGNAPHRDLLSEQEPDIYLPAYESDRRAFALPLMRSNKVNVNPVACGIYYDMFYHHCCGSGREFLVRGQGYWDRVCNMYDITQFTDKLFANPEYFVENLAGWNPNRYLKSNEDWGTM